MNKLYKNLRTGLSIWLLLPYVVLAIGGSFLHTCPGYECVNGGRSHACEWPAESCDDSAGILSGVDLANSGSSAPCAACLWVTSSSAVSVSTVDCAHAESISDLFHCELLSFSCDLTSPILPRGPPSA